MQFTLSYCLGTPTTFNQHHASLADTIRFRMQFVLVVLTIKVDTYPKGECSVAVGEEEEHMAYEVFVDMPLMDVFSRLRSLVDEYNKSVNPFEDYSGEEDDFSASATPSWPVCCTPDCVWSHATNPLTVM